MHLLASSLPNEIDTWTELNRIKRGEDFITGCGYIVKIFAGQQKKSLAYLLSNISDITVKPIAS